MEPQFSTYFLTSQVPGEPLRLNLRDQVSKYVYRWPLFLICTLLALIAALFYLRNTLPKYELKTKLMIKDESKVPNKAAALKELDFFKINKVVENETEVLKSRIILMQVVHGLQLFVEYQIKQRDSKITLYRESPIRFSLFSSLGIPGQKTTLEVLIKNKDQYILERENGQIIKGYFNKAYKNSLGTWQIQATNNITKFIGKKIILIVSDPGLTADMYAKRINIQLANKNSSIIEITLQDALPDRGKDILNSLTAGYTRYSRKENNREADKTLRSINARLSSLTDELNQAESSVERYRRSQGLTDINSESKVFLENVQRNDNQLNEVNVQLKVLQGIEEYLKSPSNSGNIPATLGIADSYLTELVSQLMALQMQKEKLLATTPEANPVFEPINRQIKKTKDSLRENIKGIKSSLLTTRKQLHAYNSRFETSIKKLPSQERQLLDIKRQQSIKENLYVYLLQKREEIIFSNESTLTENPVIDPPYISKTPGGELIILAIAFLTGIIVPVSLIFGKGLMDNHIISGREIAKATPVPVLSELIWDKKAGTGEIHSLNVNPILQEQFRTLRTRLITLHGNSTQGRVTLITSGIAGEGKSFIAANLGNTLAASGRKTIILDLDLRNPEKSGNTGKYKRHPGLTDYLRGEASREEIIQTSGMPSKLFKVAAGNTSPFAFELLENPLMGELICWLRQEFDDIVLDTPPVHLVSDALILAETTDVSLYVIRQGYTPADEINFINELNREKMFPKMHLVFNGIHVKGKYGYGYKKSFYTGFFKTGFKKEAKPIAALKKNMTDIYK